MQNHTSFRMLKMFLCCMFFVAVGVHSAKAQWEPVKYDMDIRVDYASAKIYADCKLTVTNTSTGPSRNLPLLLYRLLSVSSVTDMQGNALPFEQNIKAFDEIPRLQVNVVGIELPEKLEEGEEYSVHIKYEGFIFGYTEAIGGYVRERIEEPFTILRQDSYAYPQPGHPTIESMMHVMHHSYDYKVNITVPEHLVVANGGKFVSKTSKNGYTSYTYRNIKPAWRMDFAIASYEILEDSGIRMFYFSALDEEARDLMGVLKNTMALFTEWFEPLKDFESFSVIQVPAGYGSQMDVTSIIQSGEVFTRDDINANLNLYHELSHLWHPMEIEPRPPSRWNEGLATFTEYLAAEKLEERSGLVEKASISISHNFVNRCKNMPNCRETPLIDYGKAMMTQHSYTKGMVLFHVLYELIGHDEFMDLIKRYYQAYYKTGGSTHDLTEMIKELLHEGLTRFVDEWFYGTRSNVYLFEGKSVAEIVSIYNE